MIRQVVAALLLALLSLGAVAARAAREAQTPPLFDAIRALPRHERQVDLNRATRAHLESLPGIGPTTAERILRYRSETGPFRSTTDLLEIERVGPSTLERVRPRVRCGQEGAP